MIHSGGGPLMKSVADQLAQKLNAKLNYIPGEGGEALAMQDIKEEVEINDFPQQARWKVTSKEAWAQISKYSEVRGTYYAPATVRLAADLQRRFQQQVEESLGTWLELAAGLAARAEELTGRHRGRRRRLLHAVLLHAVLLRAVHQLVILQIPSSSAVQQQQQCNEVHTGGAVHL